MPPSAKLTPTPLLKTPFGIAVQSLPGNGGLEARAIGRSKGGLTTKIHAAVDALGLPITAKDLKPEASKPCLSLRLNGILMPR